MDTTPEPIDTIQAWQKWYQKNRAIPSIKNPMDTKGNQESFAELCVDLEAEVIKKVTTCFADTIAEYSSELSGQQFYRCFYSAAVDNFNYADKEYKKAKQLMDMLRYKNES